MSKIIGSLCLALLALAGCETVSVDSSSSGNQALSSLHTFYISSNFPVTDGSKEPGKQFQQNVVAGIQSALIEKGYTAASSAANADFVLNGSWEKGRVMHGNQPTNYTASSTGAQSKYAEYLTLDAVSKGETLWSVNSPILSGQAEELTAVLATFPAQGGF